MDQRFTLLTSEDQTRGKLWTALFKLTVRLYGIEQARHWCTNNGLLKDFEDTKMGVVMCDCLPETCCDSINLIEHASGQDGDSTLDFMIRTILSGAKQWNVFADVALCNFFLISEWPNIVMTEELKQRLDDLYEPLCGSNRDSKKGRVELEKISKEYDVRFLIINLLVRFGRDHEETEHPFSEMELQSNNNAQSERILRAENLFKDDDFDFLKDNSWLSGMRTSGVKGLIYQLLMSNNERCATSSLRDCLDIILRIRLAEYSENPDMRGFAIFNLLPELERDNRVHSAFARIVTILFFKLDNEKYNEEECMSITKKRIIWLLLRAMRIKTLRE